MGCTNSRNDGCQTLNNNKVSRGRHSPQWNKETDLLQQAVEGLGTDETCIIQTLAKFTNKERKQLLKVYQEKFQEDLIDVLESELSGPFKEVTMALLDSPVVYDVLSLHAAFESQDLNMFVIIILSSRNDRITDIKELFFKKYGGNLEDELLKLEDKDLSKILVCLINVDRPLVNNRADAEKAEQRATLLFNDGNILSLFCEPLSRNQLRECLKEFRKLHSVDVFAFIDERCSSLSEAARNALKACVMYTESPPEYFAQELQKCFTGLMAKETNILRILVSRSETDLYYIKKEFLRRFSVSLHEAIQSECCLEYAKLFTIILELRGQYSESAKKR